MPFYVIFIVIGFLLIVFGIVWFTQWADRQRVSRHFAQQGASVQRIERVIKSSEFVSAHFTTFWRVHYKAADGSTRVAECFASFLRCKVYRDEPSTGT